MGQELVITRQGSAVGFGKLAQEGLYCRIYVCCRESIRIVLHTSLGQRDLGICVPGKEGFEIRTKIPIKYLGEGPFRFAVAEEKDNFYPVRQDRPFAHLRDVRRSVMVRRDGIMGIQTVISKPTGQ